VSTSKAPKRYAEGTEVPVSKTRDELENLLERHGAGQIQVTRDASTKQAVVIFRIAERYVKLQVKLSASDVPPINFESWACKDKTIKFPQSWGAWSESKRKDWIAKTLEQREREAWRRLLLITRGKLELVADAESTVEREFLADIMLPDGSTVHEQLQPRLAESYTSGEMPRLLPGKV
jgi:hypothetical protein